MGCILLSAFITASEAASRDLGGGFRDHGVAVPLSSHRGQVATIDGAGRNVLLALLMDYRGAHELLEVDAETGESTDHPLPFDNVPDDHVGDSPYASMLSSANKFYSHFGRHFIEFEPAKGAFTFCHESAPLMAMSFTEADDGVIWAATAAASDGTICGGTSFPMRFLSYDPAADKMVHRQA